LKRGDLLEGEGRAQEEGVEDELEAGLAVNEVQEEGLNFGPRDSPGRTGTAHPRALPSKKGNYLYNFLNLRGTTCLLNYSEIARYSFF
jgi:hypothetical protein